MWCMETTLFLLYNHKIIGGGMVDPNYVPSPKLLLQNIEYPLPMSVTIRHIL